MELCHFQKPIWFCIYLLSEAVWYMEVGANRDIDDKTSVSGDIRDGDNIERGKRQLLQQCQDWNNLR